MWHNYTVAVEFNELNYNVAIEFNETIATLQLSTLKQLQHCNWTHFNNCNMAIVFNETIATL